MTKLTVTGSNGQLGWELSRRAKFFGFDIIPLDLPGFDITDTAAVMDTVKTSDADLVINAAAYTAVDKAESEPGPAFAVNRDGAANLATACEQNHIPLIHISTDYVFDGTRNRPYEETDPVSPIGVYGTSKAEGEAGIRNILTEHIIVRTSWLYGIHGSNFVKTMLRLGQEREEIRVVNDQFGCPTSAADLADAVLKISKRIISGPTPEWGTYHFCGSGETTWFAFARKIFELAGPRCDLKLRMLTPITTDQYPTPAKRPMYSVLNCQKIKQLFDITPLPWETSLSHMIDELFRITGNR